jgi:riboflavin biosynthesis pyrimidine reductase
VATVRQYVQAGLVDSIHLAVSPVALGRGESLLAGVDLRELGFQVTEYQPTEHAMHIVLERADSRAIQDAFSTAKFASRQ